MENQEVEGSLGNNENKGDWKINRGLEKKQRNAERIYESERERRGRREK